MSVRLVIILFMVSTGMVSAQKLILPDSAYRHSVKEGQTINFRVTVAEPVMPRYTLEGINGYNIQFDTLGNFSWTPPFELVDRLEKQKEINLLFQAAWKDGRKVRAPVNFTIFHQNRPPELDDLPVFYVKQASPNAYQISLDYVRDHDGDPVVFKSVQSQMPEGAALSPSGLLTWTPSRNQFNNLKNNPLTIDFIVQDQPERAEVIGKIKIAQTQLDLPPEMFLVPGDTSFTIREDERVNFKLGVTDPNGDENISNVGFVSSDSRVLKTCLTENSPVQFEFTWSPGYSFVAEVQKFVVVNLVFFALDKSSNRVQRKVKIKVLDSENLDEVDKVMYQKYRNSLIQAKILIDELDENRKVLNKAYKQAKKGKKNRAILNAGLGATTGLSPVTLPTDPSKIVSAVGGTTVLTLGTLEATEVVGKSKNDILDKLKINVEIANQLQIEGDNLARKYALKSARREKRKEFEDDREKLLPIINNQKLVMLELDASRPAYKKLSNAEIKKTFADFTEE
jgi:hypothetical protein